MNTEDTRFKMVKEHHKDTLEKAILEKKADDQVISLCRYIASTENYFTSSSCAGRILLICHIDDTKKEAHFHKTWHRTVTFDELWAELEKDVEKDLWFKLEGFILHIGCKDLEHALNILEVKRQAGIKRGGIIVAKKGKFLVELVSTANISLPVKLNKEIVIEKEYMEKILEIANNKLIKNYQELKKIEEISKQVLK